MIQPTLGFQSMKTAYATIKGFEVMRYAPELEKRSAWYRSRLSFSWRVDETYMRVPDAESCDSVEDVLAFSAVAR